MLIVDRMAERIDDVLYDYLSYHSHICGDLNSRHDQWVAHSNIIEVEDKYCHDFAIAHELNQASSYSRYFWVLR